MNMNVEFQSPISSSAKEIWGMEKVQDYTADIWGQYKSMVDYIDLINYCNGHTFDEPIQSRQAIAYLGCAMPSLAYICPHQTTDLSYFLNLVNINLPSKFMVNRMSSFNSDNLLLVQRALAAGFYKMVSGRNMYDGEFHANAKAIYKKIVENGQSTQEFYAIETLPARFEVLPNLMAIMALELHDKQFGTTYCQVKPQVLNCIKEKLQDKKTRLFYESYQTGYFGYEGETINQKSTWATKILKPSINGLALTFYNYFDHEDAKRAWNNFKTLFTEELLDIKTAEVVDKLGGSLHTQLAAEAEDLFTSLLASKELGDVEYFDKLQNHLFKIGEPTSSEGLVFFNNFGFNQHLMGHFILFARVHVGWEKLFAHNWEAYYSYDYKKVR